MKKIKGFLLAVMLLCLTVVSNSFAGEFVTSQPGGWDPDYQYQLHYPYEFAAEAYLQLIGLKYNNFFIPSLGTVLSNMNIDLYNPYSNFENTNTCGSIEVNGIWAVNATTYLDMSDPQLSAGGQISPSSQYSSIYGGSYPYEGCDIVYYSSLAEAQGGSTTPAPFFQGTLSSHGPMTIFKGITKPSQLSQIKPVNYDYPPVQLTTAPYLSASAGPGVNGQFSNLGAAINLNGTVFGWDPTPLPPESVHTGMKFAIGDVAEGHITWVRVIRPHAKTLIYNAFGLRSTYGGTGSSFEGYYDVARVVCAEQSKNDCLTTYGLNGAPVYQCNNDSCSGCVHQVGRMIAVNYPNTQGIMAYTANDIAEIQNLGIPGNYAGACNASGISLAIQSTPPATVGNAVQFNSQVDSDGDTWQADTHGNLVSVDSTYSMWNTPWGQAATNWYNKYVTKTSSMPGPMVTEMGVNVLPTNFPNFSPPHSPYPDLDVVVNSNTYTASAICSNLPGCVYTNVVNAHGVSVGYVSEITYQGYTFPVNFVPELNNSPSTVTASN